VGQHTAVVDEERGQLPGHTAEPRTPTEPRPAARRRRPDHTHRPPPLGADLPMTAYDYAPVPARHLQLRPTPGPEPPFADEPPPRHRGLVGPRPEPLPFDHPEPGDMPGRRSFEQPLDFFDRQPTSRWELPAPHEWLRQLLRVLLECLEGWRPARQLGQYAVPEVVNLVAAHRKRFARPDTAPRICSLHLTEPADGVVESCAVVHRDGRTHALAIRLEGLAGRRLGVPPGILPRPPPPPPPPPRTAAAPPPQPAPWPQTQARRAIGRYVPGLAVGRPAAAAVASRRLS